MIQDLIKLSNETDTQYLARSIQVKWWNKFDILFVRKEKIDEWVKMSQHRFKIKVQTNKESSFLAEK